MSLSIIIQYLHKLKMKKKKYDKFFEIKFNNETKFNYNKFEEYEIFTKFAHELKGTSIIFCDGTTFIDKLAAYFTKNNIDWHESNTFARK